MTERKLPDDRELEQYLKGDSPLSRRYRDASAEGTPPDLDEAILAQARAELKRQPPSLNRILAPVALAASVVLGVNLAWNLYQVEPVPAEIQRHEKAAAPEPAYVPEPPPAAQEPAPVASAPPAARRAPAVPPPSLEEKLAQDRARETDAVAALRERERAAAQSEQAKAEAEMQARSDSQRQSLQAADAMAGAAATPAPAPMTEAQKIDALVAHIARLDGAIFIRNGKEHSAADAADHLRLKRDKAGERCDTAEEFIRVCASFSSRSGEAYLIRFPDGRTRTAEDVLREQLATLP